VKEKKKGNPNIKMENAIAVVDLDIILGNVGKILGLEPVSTKNLQGTIRKRNGIKKLSENLYKNSKYKNNNQSINSIEKKN